MANAPSRSTTDASNTTTSTTTNTTSTRDIGFTGEQGANVLETLTRGVSGTLQGLSGITYQSLGDLVAGGVAVQRAGFDFSSGAIEQSASVFDRSSARAIDTLTGVINATRDFSQRAIAASSGQSTPLQPLVAASSNVPVIGEGIPKIWYIVGGLVVLWLVMRK